MNITTIVFKQFIKILISLLGIALVAIQNIQNSYPLTTKVILIEESVITSIDYYGNSWTFESEENWNYHDIATLVINGKGTEDISDDEIILVKNDGNFDTFIN